MRWSALLVALMLSGCLVDDADPETDPMPTGEDPDVPSAHGSPDRMDGDVETERQGDRYKASRIVLITNGAGAATGADVSLSTVNGGTVVRGWDEGGYRLAATLFAFGDTESEARDRLADLGVEHTDSMTLGTLTLSSEVVLPDEDGLPLINVNGDGNRWNNRGGSLVLYTPDDLSYTIDQDGTNGGHAVADVSGPRVTSDITNGGISIQGDFTDIDADCTNGGVVIRGAPLAGEGTWRASCTNGGIDVRAEGGASYGYDVTGDTTNGGVAISIPDGQTVGEQTSRHGHVRTSDFEDRARRAVMDLDTTNGGIVVRA